MNWVYTALLRVQQGIFPPVCVLCGDAGDDRLDLCAACRQDLPRIEPGCPVCGLPVGRAAPPGPCGRCLTHPPHWDRLVGPYRYGGALAVLIQRLKFVQGLALAPLLGGLLTRELPADELPGMVLPVPLHGRRLRERGYNQALEIARMPARRFGLPLRPEAARRNRATQPQTQLHRDRRSRNVRNAFRVCQDFAGVHVAIVDDVVSTGHTVNALAGALRRAGAERIDVWTIARAVRET